MMERVNANANNLNNVCIYADSIDEHHSKSHIVTDVTAPQNHIRTTPQKKTKSIRDWKKQSIRDWRHNKTHLHLGVSHFDVDGRTASGALESRSPAEDVAPKAAPKPGGRLWMGRWDIFGKCESWYLRIRCLSFNHLLIRCLSEEVPFIIGFARCALSCAGRQSCSRAPCFTLPSMGTSQYT